MIRSLSVWLLDGVFGRSKRRRHRDAWAPMRGRNADGLTPFQVHCERRLLDAFTAAGLKLTDREVGTHSWRGRPTGDLSLKWSVAGTPLEIWVHPDAATIGGPDIEDRFEERDARTPDELIDMVCDDAVRRALDVSTARAVPGRGLQQ